MGGDVLKQYEKKYLARKVEETGESCPECLKKDRKGRLIQYNWLG